MWHKTGEAKKKKHSNPPESGMRQRKHNTGILIDLYKV
jgi:hypothetical protein